MTNNWIEKVTGSFDHKRRWKAYKTRIKALPGNYRHAVEAVERYLMSSGDIPSDGERLIVMFEDLGDLFERAAADGTPIRDVVGEDPAEFAETFARTYSDGGWIAKARTRLAKSIDQAADEDGRP